MFVRRLLVFGFAVGVGSCSAWGQCEWLKVGSVGPAGRFGHAMAYDSNRDVIVLFGGVSNGVISGDVWEYDLKRSEWTLASQAGPVGPRYNHAMTFDAQRNVVVVHGGLTGTPQSAIRLGDTWEWNGSNWTFRSNSGPSPRSSHAMIWDTEERVVIVFGGTNNSIGERYNDIWTWDGVEWKLLFIGGPSPRSGYTMCYDSDRHVAVLFGGWDDTGYLGDTWEWDGNDWTLRSMGGPSPRKFATMEYDPSRSASVLTSGLTFPGGELGDTWAWNGSQWSLCKAFSMRQAWHAAAFDSLRQQHMVFDSTSRADLWAMGQFCYADCDRSAGQRVLDIFDFLCFQGSFVNGEPYACDCDTAGGVGICDIFDFLCFQGSFVRGCP